MYIYIYIYIIYIYIIYIYIYIDIYIYIYKEDNVELKGVKICQKTYGLILSVN